LLAAQRDLFRIGQDQAANTGNESALLLAGLFYLVITVPLTHAVNYIDSRLRTGRRRDGNDGADAGEDALVFAAHTQEEL
jgi:polar amino acid transport system permease protein/polar amino acid transport system substrate-binding protein